MKGCESQNSINSIKQEVNKKEKLNPSKLSKRSSFVR